MQKVSAIVIYSRSENMLHNITVRKTNGDFITLLSEDVKSPDRKKYNSFNDLCKTIHKILKNNNFYVGYKKEFDAVLYDIGFINYEAPARIDKIYYTKEVNI